jgi:hypothetical protein
MKKPFNASIFSGRGALKHLGRLDTLAAAAGFFFRRTIPVEPPTAALGNVGIDGGDGTARRTTGPRHRPTRPELNRFTLSRTP